MQFDGITYRHDKTATFTNPSWAHMLRACRVVITLILCVSLMLITSGCSKDDVVSDKHQPDRVKVQVVDCAVDDETSSVALDESIGDTETNARKVFSLLKEMGFSNENIAGVIGNWVKESGIDPSGVETIIGVEPFEFGPQKKAALDDHDNFTKNTVFPAYAGQYTINTKAYIGDDGTYYPGIGVAGFTGPATTRLLKWAEKYKIPWYSLDLQLAFAISELEDGYGRGDFWKNWEKEDSVDSATATFLAKFEGCPGQELSDRQKFANEWFEKIKDFEPDSSYAKSIIAMSKGESSTANTPTTKTKSNKSVATSDSGEKIDIPDEYDNIQENHGWGGGYKCLVEGVRTGIEGWWVCWKTYEGPQGDVARKWVEQGSKYASGNDLPLIDDRVGVVLKADFGTPGDYVDIAYKDGHLLHAIILDAQGASDDAGGVAAWSKYGHNTAAQRCNVIEWYTDGDGGLVGSGHSDPCNVPGFEYVTGVVDYIINTHGVNTGSALDGANTTSPTSEACDEAETEAGMDVAPGEAAAVENSVSAKMEWLYGDAGVPENFEEASKYFEEFPVVIRNPETKKKETMNITMHRKLKTEVQAIFQDIYSNTDYCINPSDCNTTQRGWETLNGGSVSQHSFGLAIDINASHNAGDYTECGTWNPGSDPLSIGKDHKVVQIMEKHGFGWGGEWSKRDPMHFSYTWH